MLFIKNIINYPFIYFLIEPDIVMVYQLNTLRYLTTEDFLNGMCEAYEIDTDDDFEKFNHEEYPKIEGRGFYFKQDDLIQLVDKINTHIHDYRKSSKISDERGSIHLVMSESAAGSLRVGLTRPKTVIGIPDSFDIGPLWQLDKKTGQTLRDEWLYEHINDEQEDGVYLNHFNISLRQIEDISTNDPIFIWYSENANEQVGLRFMLNLLKEKENKIFLINTTELYRKEEQSIYHTSQMDSDNLRTLFENNSMCKPLSEVQLRRFHAEWEELAETDGVLRKWVDGNIKHVLENYYDSYIIETIEKLHKQQHKKDWVRTANLLVEITARYERVY